MPTSLLWGTVDTVPYGKKSGAIKGVFLSLETGSEYNLASLAYCQEVCVLVSKKSETKWTTSIVKEDKNTCNIKWKKIKHMQHTVEEDKTHAT